MSEESMTVRELIDKLGKVPGDCFVLLGVETQLHSCLSLSGVDDDVFGDGKFVCISDGETSYETH